MLHPGRGVITHSHPYPPTHLWFPRRRKGNDGVVRRPFHRHKSVVGRVLHHCRDDWEEARVRGLLRPPPKKIVHGVEGCITRSHPSDGRLQGNGTFGHRRSPHNKTSPKIGGQSETGRRGLRTDGPHRGSKPTWITLDLESPSAAVANLGTDCPKRP